MAGLEDYIRYSNQSAKRRLPLSPKLANSLSFLKDLGLTAEVFSGGQPDAASGGMRTGSVRHDHGDAADVFFYKDGKRLDWANKEDLPLFEQVVQRGKAAGLTGFGAGPGYMQPGSMHLGFGDPAVWGAGGSSKNAPEWLRAAYNSGSSPDVLAEVMNSTPKGAASLRAAVANDEPKVIGPDGRVPPLPPPIDVEGPKIAAAEPTVGDKVGAALFGDETAASLKKIFGPEAPATGAGKTGLGMLAGAFSNKSSEQDREAAQIIPNGIAASDAADSARMQAGTQLMATMLAARKKNKPAGFPMTGLQMGV